MLDSLNMVQWLVDTDSSAECTWDLTGKLEDLHVRAKSKLITYDMGPMLRAAAMLAPVDQAHAGSLLRAAHTARLLTRHPCASPLHCASCDRT